MAASTFSDAPSLAQRLDGRGVTLLGCGKMGGAMLEGWLAEGVAGSSVQVIEPNPSDALSAQAADAGLRLTAAPEPATGPTPAVIVLAVKPQMMTAALPSVAPLAGPETLILSIAAGTPITRFAETFGPDAPIVRAMPNTPASIGRGISALVANAAADAAHRGLAAALMAAVGEAVWVETEDQLDSVTGVSGSGPAYVFHLIEALAAAGEAEGLAPDLAMRLARATVAGAGALAAASPESAEQLRVNVTSPGGTTAAGLSELMDADRGLAPLMRRTVAAAAARARALAG